MIKPAADRSGLAVFHGHVGATPSHCDNSQLRRVRFQQVAPTVARLFHFLSDTSFPAFATFRAYARHARPGPVHGRQKKGPRRAATRPRPVCAKTISKLGAASGLCDQQPQSDGVGKVTSETIETIQATVIPWETREGIWGVAIHLPNGRSTDYEVGSKAAAENECKRIAAGEPPSLGPWAGMILLT